MERLLFKILYNLMATRVGLFEANVYFSPPFKVRFPANLTGQTVFYFSATNLACHAY